MGADIFRDEVDLDGAVVSLVLWDTGGALQLQRLGQVFFERANCVMLLADLMDPGAPSALPLLEIHCAE